MVTSAVRGAKKAGLTVARIEIEPDGRIILLANEDRQAPRPNPWDEDLPK
jgi:hypothetical protein